MQYIASSLSGLGCAFLLYGAGPVSGNITGQGSSLAGHTITLSTLSSMPLLTGCILLGIGACIHAYNVLVSKNDVQEPDEQPVPVRERKRRYRNSLDAALDSEEPIDQVIVVRRVISF